MGIDKEQAASDAYAVFEEKESRLLDHWFAPLVAAKAFRAGYDARDAEVSSLTAALENALGRLWELGPKEMGRAEFVELHKRELLGG